MTFLIALCDCPQYVGSGRPGVHFWHLQVGEIVLWLHIFYGPIIIIGEKLVAISHFVRSKKVTTEDRFKAETLRTSILQTTNTRAMLFLILPIPDPQSNCVSLSANEVLYIRIILKSKLSYLK